MNKQNPSKVFLIDDDASIRTALTRGLSAEGFQVQSFDSADAFLAEHDPTLPGCSRVPSTVPAHTVETIYRAGCAPRCPSPGDS